MRRTGPYAAPPDRRCTSRCMGPAVIRERHMAPASARKQCSWTATTYVWTKSGGRARLCDAHVRYWADQGVVTRVAAIRICEAPVPVETSQQ